MIGIHNIYPCIFEMAAIDPIDAGDPDPSHSYAGIYIFHFDPFSPRGKGKSFSENFVSS